MSIIVAGLRIIIGLHETTPWTAELHHFKFLCSTQAGEGEGDVHKN